MGQLENKISTQMRKGILEYCVLLAISEGPIYTSEILKLLTEANLLVVEGTIYPLLSRLTKDKLLKHEWKESKEGPPRKYYSLTKAGKDYLKSADKSWSDLSKSINLLRKKK